jgi:type 1 glutamine amidotransferase
MKPRAAGLSSLFFGLSLVVSGMVAGIATGGADVPAPKINLLIVTGGHNFDPKAFLKLFDDNAEVTYTVCDQKKVAEAWDRDDLAKYDVVLLYDFQEEINDAQKAKFLSLFDRGTGLFVLHHALLSYQHWPEYERIVGGKYLLDNEKLADGTTRPSSTYEADVELDVKVADKDHPATKGVGDFHMKDEFYRRVPNTSDIKVVLEAEGRPMAWTREEKKSRVFSIIIGHGSGTYDDPNFQKILAQALRWLSEPHQKAS